MRDFLFLDPGADVTRRDVYERGRRLGMRVVLVSTRMTWERPYVDEWIQANPAVAEEVIAVLHDRRPPAGVVNCSESCLQTAAALKERYRLPGLPPEVARCCRDKVLMGRALTAHGVPMPRRFLLRRSDRAEAAVAAVGLPGVLKPSTGVASRYTVRFDSVAELRMHVDAFNEQLRQHLPAFLRHMDGRWLVEEYLHGTGYSVESVTSAGAVQHVAVCEKGPIAGRHFREVGHVTPPLDGTADLASMGMMTEQAIRALGIDDCVTHTEFKASRDGVRLLEIGARMGGGSIRQVVLGATGVDLLQVTLELALGRRVTPTPRSLGAAASRSLYPSRAGRVVSLDVAGLARRRGVDAVNVWLGPGEDYRLPPDGYGEVLGVVTRAANPAEAVRLAESAVKWVEKGTVLTA
jgi:biotin carboxylase